MVLCAWTLACQPTRRPADDRVSDLARGYLDGYFERNPDQVTIYGIPGRHHDKLPDNSLDALTVWQAREDAWLKTAAAIDPAAVASPSLRATYAIAREALEGSIVARQCRRSGSWRARDAFRKNRWNPWDRNCHAVKSSTPAQDLRAELVHYCSFLLTG